MSALDELAKHVGHRTTLVDVRRLRCLECTQTVALPAFATGASTSRDSPRPSDPGQCREHAGEWADACRACRAERIADETRQRPEPTSTAQGRDRAREEWERYLNARARAAARRHTTQEIP